MRKNMGKQVGGLISGNWFIPHPQLLNSFFWQGGGGISLPAARNPAFSNQAPVIPSHYFAMQAGVSSPALYVMRGVRACKTGLHCL